MYKKLTWFTEKIKKLLKYKYVLIILFFNYKKYFADAFRLFSRLFLSTKLFYFMYNVIYKIPYLYNIHIYKYI